MKGIKNFLSNIELYIAMITISVTTVIVILNVIFRYIFSIQFIWLEEISLGCFIWTVYLGAVVAYKRGRLIGVDFLLQVLPKGSRIFLELATALLMVVANAVLLIFSISYARQSGKVTAALEISYIYINIALVISFVLMLIHSSYLLIHKALELKNSKGAH
ncbi:MAG: TRAP transporter small permease [Brevinema sp.]